MGFINLGFKLIHKQKKKPFELNLGRNIIVQANNLVLFQKKYLCQADLIYLLSIWIHLFI